MIHTNRVVTVGEQESIIDRPIVLYRGDREVEIEFTLVGNEFTFSEEGNVIKSVNASHGQLVLNTPSGENMFSELAECNEGKVVFVVTKEMIDEFIEMGFYSFQIRLYDSAEMKSRVTIPPVLSGFDIRNPIAAEDETNVVDQGIVDYARIFKDQANEELSTFDWQGNYNKTEWVHHDVITENKMNKIEDALYSINANIKESDVAMLNTLDQVKKDADAYVKEHMAEVEADVDEFERNINTGVEKFKADTNAAMTAHKNEVSEVVDGFSGEIESINSQLVDIDNQQSLHDISISTLQSKISGVVNGSPIVVTNYSEMTDINKIYLYVGNETNYNYGNWYYHNGSNWVCGGVYQSSKLGLNEVKIDNLSNEIIEGLINEEIKINWENGNISNGMNDTFNENYRIRSTNIVFMKKGSSIKCTEPGIKMLVSYYDENKNFLKVSAWIPNYIYFNENSYVRIVVSYNDEPSFDSLENLANKIIVSSEDVNNELKWYQGGLSNGIPNEFNYFTRIKSSYIRVEKGDKIFVKDSNTYTIMYINLYDKHFNYSGVSDKITIKTIHPKVFYTCEHTGYIRIQLHYNTETEFVSIDDLSSKIQIKKCEIPKTNLSSSIIKEMYDNIIPLSFEHGNIDGNGVSDDYNSNTRIRSTEYIPVFKGMELIATPDVFFYAFFYNENGQMYNVSNITRDYLLIETNGYMKLMLRYQSEEEFDNLESLSEKVQLQYDANGDYLSQPMLEAYMETSSQLSLLNPNTPNIIFFTDSHAFYKHTRLAVMLANGANIDTFVHGGDFIRELPNTAVESAKEIARYTKELNKLRKPLLSVKGNHEIAEDQLYKNETFYNQLIKPFASENFIFDENDKTGGYYFIDDENYKIRTIVVNTCHSNTGTSISWYQLQWLANRAFDLSEKPDSDKWSVIVFGHKQILPCLNTTELSLIQLADILKAVNEKTVYESTSPAIDVDFSRQNFTLIGYVHGHTHLDTMFIDEDYGFLNISTICSQAQQATSNNDLSTSFERKLGTTSEFAFDVINIDTENRFIQCIRVGAGNNRQIYY